MKKNSDKKSTTREHLLDVAEELFALKGRDSVSIKEITDKANTRLAAVNYYFDNKAGLYSEVIMRRASTLSADRISILEKINFEISNSKSLVTSIVNAFVDPLLQRSTAGDSGWKNYCQLIANEATKNLPTGDDVEGPKNLLLKSFNDTALRFIESISRALPNLTNKQAHYAFQFMLSTTLYTFTENERIDSISGGKYKSSDLVGITDEMTEYIIGGLLGMDSRASNNR